MDDDLEDLLDKIEHRFGNNRNKILQNNNRDDEEVDDLINLDLSYDSRRSSKSEVPYSKQSGKTRCHEVFVGGCGTELGNSTLLTNKPCASLRCTACDFSVSSFDNFQWNESVDYLFLRNNMPDFNKLKTKFRKKPGCRAYACQCTWLNCQKLELLKEAHPSVKWVCGKH